MSLVKQLSYDDLEQWRKSRSKELDVFRDWLRKQSHLPQKVPDEHLMLFLHSSHYNVEEAKSRLDSYFTIRTQAPEIFTGRIITSKEMEKALKVTRISPKRFGTPEGYSVIYVDSLDPDVANFSFTEAMKVAGLAMDVLVKCFPKEKGGILVFDMQNSAFAHVIKTNLFVLKKAMAYAQKALPFRLLQIHVINAFPLIQHIHILLKPFMDEKLSKIFHIHMQDNMETLYKFIPKNYLPKDYGGESESLEKLNSELIEMINNHVSYLKNLEFLVVDESRRVQTSYDASELKGSFRKLDID